MGLSGRVAARRARFLMYSLANTFSPRGGGGFSPRGNLLAKQPGSNPVGSGSKHIDCSIWAQLPHPTGILVRFGDAPGKKTRRPCVSCRPDQSMGRWTPLCNNREDLSAFPCRAPVCKKDLVCEASGCWQGTTPSTLLRSSTLWQSLDSPKSSALSRLASFLAACRRSHRQTKKEKWSVQRRNNAIEFLWTTYVLLRYRRHYPRPRRMVPAERYPRPRRTTP